MKKGAIFIFLCFSYAFAQQNAKMDDLKTILHSAGDYCDKMKDIALYYVAKERIEDTKYIYRTEAESSHGYEASQPEMLNSTISSKKPLVRGTKKRTQTYDYQLISRNDGYEEKRTLVEENGKAKHQENARLTGLPFVSEKLVFGPVGFLSSYWQDYFRYEILGNEAIGERSCLIVKATPKKPPEEMEGNNKVARIWLDETDHCILRIEVEARSIQGFREENVEISNTNLKHTVICRTEYDVEKNGIRFPGKQIFRDVLLNPKTEDQVVLEEITYTYSDYKFFIVGVEVKY